ncbi:hypothetical protein WP12_17760 [Sphingomonas sp. SRS2]|nr:hypothetical protein WP12_17760 [Sphingomonas sp. SRS2]
MPSVPVWGIVLSALITAVGSGGIGVLITKYWEHQRRKRAQTDNVLLELVNKQGRQLKAIRREQRVERHLCEARLAAQRHKVVNLDSAFEGVLMLFKAAPEKVPELIPEIVAQRQAHRETEAAEAAAVMKASLEAAVKAAEFDESDDGEDE